MATRYISRRNSVILGISILALLSFSKHNNCLQNCGEKELKFPKIFVVTPTAKRLEQKADLTRFSQTLKLIKNIHWIVVEDSYEKNEMIGKLLNRTELSHTHLFASSNETHICCGKAQPQRNRALRWLRKNFNNTDIDGVVYFADDDNSYDIRLFDNYIRNVKSIGIWPVAFVGGNVVETPVVKNHSIVGWNVTWNNKRSFATDMAGFAINLNVILPTNVTFPDGCIRRNGLCCLESCFLEKFNLTLAQLEVYGFENEQEKEILVWHTRTSAGVHRGGGNKGFIV